MSSPHVLFLHARLAFSGSTERLLEGATRLERSGTRVTILAQDGSRRPAFEAAGIRVRTSDLPTHPKTRPFAAWRARRIIAELAPDLVHVTTEELAGLAAAIAPTLRIPYVLEVHRPPTARIPRFAPRLKAVGISGPTLAEPVVNHGAVARDLLVEVPHAPAPPEELRAMPFGHSGTLRIGTSGRLDDQHGTELFLAAVERLADVRRRCHFAILGEGPREQAIRRRVRERGLADRVTVGSPVTATAVETMAALDLHVSCRLSGTPDWLAHLALALGLPSVLTAVGESFHLIEDGISGCLVERNDPDALARCLGNLIETPLVARTLGNRARDRWREEHPPEQLDEALARLHACALEPVA